MKTTLPIIALVNLLFAATLSSLAQQVPESISGKVLANLEPKCSVRIEGPERVAVNDDDDIDPEDGSHDEELDYKIEPVPGENETKMISVTGTMAETCKGTATVEVEIKKGLDSRIEGFWPGRKSVVDKDGNVISNDGNDTDGREKRSGKSHPYTFDVSPGQKVTVHLWIEGIKHSTGTEPDVLIEAKTSYNRCQEHGRLGPEKLEMRVYQVDLDIDSQNLRGVEIPAWGLDTEDDKIEHCEEDTQPGKYVVTGVNQDSDGDGTPDFADGLGQPRAIGSGNSGTCGDDAKLVPVRIELHDPIDPQKATVVFSYKANIPRNGEGFTKTGAGTPQDPVIYRLAGAGMRLWAVDAHKRSGNDETGKNVAADEPARKFIPSGSEVAWRDLCAAVKGEKLSEGNNLPRELVIFLEYVEDYDTLAGNATLAGTREAISITEKAESKEVAKDPVHVSLVAMEVQYVTSKWGHDDFGDEIQIPESARSPLGLPKSNEMIEETQIMGNSDGREKHRIAHSQIMVRLVGGKGMAGKRLTWGMKPWGVLEGSAHRGDWERSLVPEHRNRFEQSTIFGTHDFRLRGQTGADTAIVAEGANAHSAARANVPPFGWNHADIKIGIEGVVPQSFMVRFVVPAVVVVDAGHGGDNDINAGVYMNGWERGNSTANNAKSGWYSESDKKPKKPAYPEATGILEKNLTPLYASELTAQLQALHADENLPLRSYQTRIGDNNMGGYERARVARDRSADILLSLHFNSHSTLGPRGSLVTSRKGNNLNLDEDEAFEARLVPPVNAAILAIDPTPRLNQSPHLADNAVTSDVRGFYHDANYHPIRSTLLEVEFIHNQGGDTLINGPNRDCVKSASMRAAAQAILAELREFVVIN
ncbi:MAG: N-acetylmuramoyl-L-alanine amidase [Verrucomicrobia bacterium]|nr:N-acetylmuramoyl-L-alanine amidase [Verrucomicrobiota bacterium]